MSERFNRLAEEARERRQTIVEQNGNSGIHHKLDGELETKTNKYKVNCKGEEIDVYDVLVAFKVTNPAVQHAVKKLLKAGNRGYKNKFQDYTEAIESINRGIELIKE
jgi:fructose-specific phosphotransferase system component IIB